MNAKNSMMEKRGRKAEGIGYSVKLGGMPTVKNFVVSSGATSHDAAKGTYEKMTEPVGQGSKKKK